MSDEAPDVELVLAGRSAELPGGLHVLRALPQARRRMVGPFVFLDQMGPADFAARGPTTILSHPHIGLSTVTYLFEGEGLHKDSLGAVQRILPGDVNWMTAGRGIVHLETLNRSGAPPPALVDGGTPSARVFGIQIWVALPQQFEETAPSFHHHAAATLPALDEPGVHIRVVAGTAFGKTSPVHTHSDLFYADVTLEPGAAVKLDAEHVERGVFVATGKVELGERALAPGELAVLARGREVVVRAPEAARLLLFGGEPLDGSRHIYWNFVSSSRERIEQAKEEWRAQRFGKVPGETDFIPLPELKPPPPVDYP